MSAAREAVLARVRAALADRPRPDPPGQVPRPAVAADPVALFAERVGEYRATVHEVAPAAVATAIAAICAEHGARRLAVPSDLPGGWLPAGIETLPDPDVAVLDGLDESSPAAPPPSPRPAPSCWMRAPARAGGR